MRLRDIKLVVTDLDNTLLRRDKTVSAYTIDVFRRLRERNVVVAFATARSLKSTLEFRIMLNPDAHIVTGGCLVFAGEQLLRSYFLPEPGTAALLAELQANPEIKGIGAISMNARYSSTPIYARTEGCICVDFNTMLPDAPIHCYCYTDDSALMRSIAARYPEFSFLHISDSDLYDINPKEATKFNGVKILSEHFNIPISEIAAFGDDHNDVEMLGKCGFGIAMSNAINEAQAAASYMCGDCDEDGVARWLEEHVLS